MNDQKALELLTERAADADEKIASTCSCKVRLEPQMPLVSVVMAVTDRRVLIYGKKFRGTVDVSLPLDSVISIERHRSAGPAVTTIRVAAREYRIRDVPQEWIEAANTARARI